MEIAAAAGGLETLEKERKIKLHTSLDLLNNRGSARRDTAKTVIISGVPEKELTNVKKVDKDTGDRT